MSDGTTPNTTPEAATQGSGQTPAPAVGAGTPPPAASTPTAPQEQAAQPGTLQLTQSQLDDLIQTRVARALRADRRKRTTEAAPAADGKPPAAAEAESDQDELRTQLERIQAQLAARDAELAAERRAALVAKAVSTHRLPADLADRILGQTAAEIDADAAKLAKLIGPPPAPRTEAGGGAKPTATPPAGPPPGTPSALPATYPFQAPGDVAW